MVGFDPSNVLSGSAFIGKTDGDTGGAGSDFRYYQDGVRTEDKGKTAFSGVFLGGATPVARGAPALFDPTNVIVTAADGTLGFRWAEVLLANPGKSYPNYAHEF